MVDLMMPGSSIRALAVLELFARVRRALRLRDVVFELQLPNSSVAELLKDLSRTGYLAFDPRTRSYFPTPKVVGLGDWLSERADADEPVRTVAAHLNETTQELVLVGVPNGLNVQYVLSLSSRHPVRYVVQAGVQRPLVKAGVGWALLSLEADAAVERCYRRTAALRSAGDLPTLDALRTTLEQVRTDGYAFSRNSVHEGASIVASPFTADDGALQRFAIGIGGPTDRMEQNRDEYARLLRQACRAH